MCGRYYVEIADEFSELYSIVNEAMKRKGRLDFDIETGEVFPTMLAPVISNNKNMSPAAFPMRWGFKSNNGGSVIFNARSESAGEKPMFNNHFKNRRCLIPATYYFEWKNEDGKKIKHAIKPPGVKTIYMAGLYRFEKDVNVPVFTVLTRDADKSISHIHHRMPVILPKETHDEWLSPSGDPYAVIDKALIEMLFEKIQ